MKAAVYLADRQKRMVFELRPDIFPPFLTPVEIELWNLYVEERKQSERIRGR